MIPLELTALDRWVCVRNGSKAPMKAFEYRGASVSNPEDWSDYECAATSVMNGVYDGVGFVFAGDGYVGIDIDRGYDEPLFISPMAAEIIDRCGSYTETSRSGRGFHIILKGTLPFDGRNNGRGVEIYQNGRYFITTGKQITLNGIRENQEAINWILKEHFADAMEAKQASVRNPRLYTPAWDKPAGRRICVKPRYGQIGEGERNMSLTSLGGQLRSAGLNGIPLFKELMKCNAQACSEPLSSNEIYTIALSMGRYDR